ncbi:MAG: glycosyltransferase family 61 protein [Cyanobium sp. M30B3]|nr:MAG: glycosyltransferase family 61 protein [Cyanobium sp. M30B3]
MPLLQHSLIHDVHRDRVKASHVLNQRIKQHLKKSTRHPLITLHDRICYPLCNEGSGTWGHWIGHNLPRALIFLDAHPDGLVIVPKSYFGRRSSFGAVLAKYISKDSIYQAPENTVISIRHCASVDLPYAKGVFHPLMVEYIKKLRLNRSGQVQSNHYIKRAGRRRSIVNNSELEYALQDFNIRPVALDLGDVDHQLELWASSGLVMGVLGSDLVNMALGSPEAICAITPHWFGDVFFYGLASALGIIWNEYYGGVIHEEHRPLHSSTFNLDINEFCVFLNYALIGSS